MNLEYEEFKRLVPKETGDFVDYLLDNIFDRAITSAVMRIDGEYKTISSDIAINFLAFCVGYNDFSSRTKAISANMGYKNNTKFNYSKNSLVSKKDAYAALSKYFCLYQDKAYYKTLSIEAIMGNILRQSYSEFNGNSYSPEIYGGYYKLGSVRDNYEKMSRDLLKEENDNLLKESIGNMPADLFTVYEYSAKALSYMLSRKSQLQGINSDIDDLVAMSFLMGTIYYLQNNCREENAIVYNILTDNDVTLSKISSYISISESDLKSTMNDKSITFTGVLLTTYYKKYLPKEADMDSKIPVLANNVKDLYELINMYSEREYSNSYSVDKFLASVGYSIEKLTTIKDSILEKKEETEKEILRKELEKFYGDLSKESRAFIILANKIYSLILEEYNSGNYNKRYITSLNDIDTLSILIADYLAEGKISKFFLSEDITLESILNLLKLNIDLKKIEDLDINQDTLINVFKRFIYEGINRNRSVKSTTPTEIANNLCNSSFNKSNILMDIFSKLSNGGLLDSDFYNQLQNWIVKYEEEHNEAIQNEIIDGLDYNTIMFLVALANNSNRVRYGRKISENDVRFFSTLITASLFDKNTILNSYMNHLGIYANPVANEVGISTSYDNITNNYNNFDINEIYNTFYKYVDKNQPVTVGGIIEAIIMDSLSLKSIKYLGDRNISIDSFKDIETKLKEYSVIREEEAKKEKVYNALNGFDSNIKTYYENAVRIFSRIKAYTDSVEYNNAIVKTDKDITELSLVISLFKTNADLKFFKKNGIKLSKVLEYTELPEEILKDLGTTEFDFDVFAEQYSKYANYFSYKCSCTFDNIMKSLFVDSINDSMVIETITDLEGYVYDIFKEEVSTGNDYVEELTLEERNEALTCEVVDNVNLTNTRDVIEYGNSLTPHGLIIQDVYPSLTINSVHGESVAELSKMISSMKVTTVESQKLTGWQSFKNLFSDVKPESKEVTKFDISKIPQIKASAIEYSEKLEKQIIGFSTLKGYMESYRIKNSQYIEKTEAGILEVEKLLNELPEDDEHLNKRLDYIFYLEALRAKLKRFKDTDLLIKTELVTITKEMIKHEMTRDALDMMGNTILPFVGAELAISIGNETEQNALDLSNAVIGFFTNILEHNSNGTKESLSRLRDSYLSNDAYDRLESSLSDYLLTVDRTNTMLESIKTKEVPVLVMDSSEEEKSINKVKSIGAYTPQGYNFDDEEND